MLKDLIKQTCSEIIIYFDEPLPIEYVSDEDLKMALIGIETIKEYLFDERLRNIQKRRNNL